MKLKTKDIAIFAMMIASIEVAKQALAFVPNVELVSLLFMLYTRHVGRKVCFIVPVFILIEGLIYGFGIWWFMYLYIWPLWILVSYLFKKENSVILLSIIIAIFGVLFGALCSIVYFFIGGMYTAIGWWIAGFPYDILHGVSNFILCLVLFKPLDKCLSKLF